MSQIKILCPYCADGFTTSGDRHARTKQDVCPNCEGTAIAPARTGETPATSFTPSLTNPKPKREEIDHEFKSHPDVFWPAARGEKTFEFRKDDRGGYHIGQTVRIRCYLPLTKAYVDTPPLDRVITNILRPGEFGLQDGYCILSLASARPSPGDPVRAALEEASPLWNDATRVAINTDAEKRIAVIEQNQPFEISKHLSTVCAHTLGIYDLTDNPAIRELAVALKACAVDGVEAALSVSTPTGEGEGLDPSKDGFAPKDVRPSSDDVHAWISRAYRDPKDTSQRDAARFTRWNMEVAFQAGFGAGYRARPLGHAKMREALMPFAELILPLRPQGNAGFYSIRFRDIERAAEVINTPTTIVEGEGTEAQTEAPIYAAFARYVGDANTRASDFRMFATGYHAALAHPQQGGEREREIEAVAEHLHEERDCDRQWTWPTHPKDDGYRGHNHRLTITPPDVQARLREEAGRILTRVDQLRRSAAPTSLSDREDGPDLSYSGAPMPPNGIEGCVYCGGAFKEGDLVLDEVDGGRGHAACCGPDRESYVGADGDPLKDDEPIPAGYSWTPTSASKSSGEEA